MTAIRIVVADDDANVRNALVALLGTDPTMQVVGSAGSTAEAVSVCGFLQPDVVVMDVKMPGGGGATATRMIRKQRPGTRIVALTAYQDRTTVLEMLNAGASGYVVKGTAAGDITDAIRHAVAGRAVLSPTASAAMVDELTARLRAEQQASIAQREHTERIKAAIDGGLHAVVQPIVDLHTRRTVGVEALARFAGDPSRTPDVWFADASELGLRAELETTAFVEAIAILSRIPEDQFLSVNISPEVAIRPDFWRNVPEAVIRRLVVEITEHAPVHDYDRLRRALAAIRSKGARIAVDDAGAGFASLRHILLLGPDFIKIDASLTQDLDRDPPKLALVSALVFFATEIGAAVIAEGIERDRDLESLKALGAAFGQGYLLGRPMPAVDLPLDPHRARATPGARRLAHASSTKGGNAS